MTPEPEPLLEVRGLEVRYGGVPAVRGIDLEVRKGEIVGLIGPNGAGKSTTLHAIMGAVPASAGEIRLAGTAVQGRSPERIVRSGVALVPEGRRIFAELTVEENLRLGLCGRRSREGEAEALESVDEPSLGLAPSVVDAVFEALRAIGERGLTILLVEQRAERTVGFADRTYVM